MIHYHGTPCGGTRAGATSFLAGRFALVPWQRAEDMEIALSVCRGVIADNSAFTAWRSGEPITDWQPYYEWIESFHRHPRFDWAIIPDVIDGSEADNDRLIDEWPEHLPGVPVWHYHESLERLAWLANSYRRICLGSSGDWPTPGTESWWERTNQIMAVIAPNGEPITKLHGLRMLNPAIFTRLPLASADSTNAAQNASREAERHGLKTAWQGAVVTAWKIEQHQSAARWQPLPKQSDLFALAD